MAGPELKGEGALMQQHAAPVQRRALGVVGALQEDRRPGSVD